MRGVISSRGSRVRTMAVLAAAALLIGSTAAVAAARPPKPAPQPPASATIAIAPTGSLEPSQVYAELGEVSVSEDGEKWLTFPCDTEGDGQGSFPGCAGFTPALDFDPLALVPLDPEQTGGDAFDLGDVGLESARFIKIVDLSTLEPAGNSSGFDLDAVGLFHED